MTYVGTNDVLRIRVCDRNTAWAVCAGGVVLQTTDGGQSWEPILLGTGELLLWRMGVNTTNAEAARNMVIAGIGLGMMMQIFVLSVQNSVPRRAMGSATALSQFSRSIGATLGVTLMGVIVNQRLPAAVRANGTAIHRLPAAGRLALANALHPAFLAAAVLCALVFVISLLWVREVPLSKGLEEEVTVGAVRSEV